jgi:predicted lipoprotein with Yx(FWY)xxD motif
MKFSRTSFVTVAAFTITAGAVAGGVAIAAAHGGSSASTYGAPATSRASGASGSSSSPSNTVALHTSTAMVQGTSERILVDGKGDPLYFYEPDTPTQSRVSGQLAVLWPPIVGNRATAQGASGKLTTVATSNGRQVAYNGHFLYTFVQDKPGQVTGQGVENFFVATPGLSPVSSQASTPPASIDGMY